MPTPTPSCATQRQPRWRRLLRGLALAVASGGWLWWRALCRISIVAARAPTVASTAAIVIPGFRLRVDEVSSVYALRLDRALLLWRLNPQAVVLLSGRALDVDSQSEALAGFVQLSDRGLPVAATVLLDESAQDTEQNLCAAARLLGALSPVTVVSNRWHLARCALLARRQGLDWRICAAERRWRPGFYAWIAVAREALSLLSFLGKEAARFEPRGLLERRS